MSDGAEEFAGVKFAADCPPCECCGEPWCEDCEDHYADCACKGPNSEEDDDEPTA